MMTMRCPWLAVSLLVVSGMIAIAQEVPPVLMVQDESGSSNPLTLTRYDVSVTVHGFVAETSITMTFHNPNDRVLAGDLHFPLPDGSTVSGYALDIEGRMVDGVAVEKDKGRTVFENIVRRGIDPGLVEWTKGNNFKTRVFPIPAKGSRMIRVDYVSHLPSLQDATYRLPLKFKEPIGEFNLRLEVVQPSGRPMIVEGDLAGLKFEPWRQSFVAEAAKNDFLPKRDIVFALPDIDRRPVLVETAANGECYFAILSKAPGYRGRAAASIPLSEVVLFWDASGSRTGADRNREIEFLRQWFAETTAGRQCRVQLVVLRDQAEDPQPFVVENGDAEKLLEAIRAIRCDGGTQLGALKLPPGEKPQLALLFSDGLQTFGRSETDKLGSPLCTLSSGTTHDSARLRQLAMTNGGRYINLQAADNATAIASLGIDAPEFMGAMTLEAASVDGICPTMPQAWADYQLVCGRLEAAEANVRLNYHLAGGGQAQEGFLVRQTDAVGGNLLERIWAQTKLADLIVFQDENEAEILSLGKRHGIVTPFTSLIVLDSLEQYLENEICPPESLPEMRNEYLRQMDTLERQQKQEQEDRFSRVEQMWKERIAWWDKTYKYPKNFEYKEQAEGGAANAAPGHMAPRPEAPAAPAAPAEPMDAELRNSDLSESEDSAPTPRPSVADAPFGDRPAMRRAEAAGEESPASKQDGEGEDGRQPGIVVKKWTPDTPYLKELAKADAAYATYLELREEYADAPSFFLDCADFFHDAGQEMLAIRVLSNLAELKLDNPQVLRVLGHRLLQWGEIDLSILTFEEVLRLRPEEPQSYRDLALALARRAETSDNQGLLGSDLSRALELLNTVVMGRWDERFAGIEIIALEEANAILPLATRVGAKEIPIDKRLVKLLDVDVRIVMTWHADNTDIDLHVIEPSGEKVDYSHNRSVIGGMISDDFTGGYGPEEYMVRRAMPGVYMIKAHFYGSQSVELLGSVTVQADIYTHYGRPGQKCKSLTFQLKQKEDVYEMGKIEF
ncbi:MAG: DUF2135 domain-containing protein [Pirellulaceae bacterium]|nr:DUF2135 domain-containing protein [Pirellulaceae bacterium]